MRTIRYLEPELSDLCFKSGKMAFVSGPRQVGKTTFAKALLSERTAGAYYNWDEIKFRRLWVKDPTKLVSTIISSPKPLFILDEIHKAKLWKRTLKGIYDTLEHPCDILVTGSAKLNVYRRGSDSLLGRYYHFRLHPFSLHEALSTTENPVDPSKWLNQLFNHELSIARESYDLLMQLDKFGGFPEPLLAQSQRKLNLWQKGRIERLIREDLRDISRLPELSQVEMLASLLPERAANLLSITSLTEDLEVSFNTVKNWLHYLKELFYCYEIKPFSTSLPRSIKKEGKLYLWDWSEVENDGARFENMIGSHLLKYVHYLTDTGYGKYDLKYIRNKEKKEIDFLLTKDDKPWVPIEVKLSDTSLSPNWHAFMKYLTVSRGIQVVAKKDIFQIHEFSGMQILVISANIFLSYLI